MPESALTYGVLDKRLRALGFAVHTQQGKARVYQHERTGATVILPDAPFKEEVPAHHVVVVQHVLREHDLEELAEKAAAAEADQGRSELAWRAFFLGLRLAAAAKDVELRSNDIPALVKHLYAIGGGGNTLHDPTVLASGMPGPTAEWIIHIGNQSITADRDLAAMILRGFEAATKGNEEREQPGPRGKRRRGTLPKADK
jgi:hypothetical protein